MSEINRVPVTGSSNIISIGHDESTQTLEVEFKSGDVYRYEGVPSSVHKDLMCAESVGRFLNDKIKGGYAHSKVEKTATKEGEVPA